MNPYPFVLLASASPRRGEILAQLGIEHAVLQLPPAQGADEPILPGEAPLDYVWRTATEKAQRARDYFASLSATQQAGLAKHQQGAVLLCADTTVALDEQILGKPENAAAAHATLRALAARSHLVHTAVVLVPAIQALNPAADFAPLRALSTSEVRFKPLSDAEIHAYISSAEPFGKAGAYAIQGRGAAFVEHISGSHSGIMGLPAFETCELLRAPN